MTLFHMVYILLIFHVIFSFFTIKMAVIYVVICHVILEFAPQNRTGYLTSGGLPVFFSTWVVVPRLV